jgi:putative Holliday junction resolvase
MPICNLYDMINAISLGQKLLGLDVGKKTIGLALADPQSKVASPQPVLWRKKFTTDATLLIEQIVELNIGGLVLGWPLNMDGTAGPRCDSVRDFAHAFLRLHEIPISFQDERLSTQAVEREMIAADMTRAKRAIRRDSLAAVWILQSALDAYHHQ